MAKNEYTFSYKDLPERKKKNIAILDCIRRKREISRTDISKETDINIVSVSNYVTSYIKKGLVSECGRDISTGGRRPELVRLNLESACVAGLDIGPEKLIAVFADLSLKVKSKVILPRPEGPMDTVMKGALEALEKLFSEAKKPAGELKLIGIGASGIMDICSGEIHDTDPKRGKTKSNLFSLARDAEKKFGVPTLVGNDATCAAFGEMSLSSDTTVSDMLYIYADVGCGIIINRDVYCGASGGAGEIQLVPTNEEVKRAYGLEIASYGIKGLDLGIVDKTKEIIQKGRTSVIKELAGGEVDAITKEIIFKAAKEKDELAREILTDAANWLGVKVAYLVNIFNPQLVIIGGGMEKAGGIFSDALAACVKLYAFKQSFEAAKVMPSFLGEEAVAIGAASLAARELFINA